MTSGNQLEDSLTGLLTRKAFLDEFSNLIQAAALNQQTFSLAMVDIDVHVRDPMPSFCKIVDCGCQVVVDAEPGCVFAPRVMKTAAQLQNPRFPLLANQARALRHSVLQKQLYYNPIPADM
jgi:hypothetical protein